MKNIRMNVSDISFALKIFRRDTVKVETKIHECNTEIDCMYALEQN